ncbi:unnamed protein product, partial [Vitis vinifera]|uniref:Uncharacterized protein n=1 Tax=Vitis vinifera TaxID=29760 RepID=D7SZZ9_VITVI
MAVGSGQWAVFSVFPSNCNYGGYSAEAVFILAEFLLLSCSNSPQLETAEKRVQGSELGTRQLDSS